ncbi:hypothetical protein ACXPVS_14630 [Pseudomonas sp. Ma2-10]
MSTRSYHCPFKRLYLSTSHTTKILDESLDVIEHTLKALIR